MKRKTTWALALVAGALLLAAGLLVGIDHSAVASEPVGAAALVGGPMSDGAGLGSMPDMDPMAAGGPYPTSCSATNQCQCCPISCTGSHSCIAYSNYVSCDGVTKYCGTPCC